MNDIQGLENYPQETDSEACKNYAMAAFLAGLALMAVGSGIGHIVGVFRGKAKKAAAEAAAE